MLLDVTGVDYAALNQRIRESREDMKIVQYYAGEYCKLFGCDLEEVLSTSFTVVSADSSNPYKQMYVAN